MMLHERDVATSVFDRALDDEPPLSLDLDAIRNAGRRIRRRRRVAAGAGGLVTAAAVAAILMVLPDAGRTSGLPAGPAGPDKSAPSVTMSLAPPPNPTEQRDAEVRGWLLAAVHRTVDAAGQTFTPLDGPAWDEIRDVSTGKVVGIRRAIVGTLGEPEADWNLLEVQVVSGWRGAGHARCATELQCETFPVADGQGVRGEAVSGSLRVAEVETSAVRITVVQRVPAAAWGSEPAAGLDLDALTALALDPELRRPPH
jgi:hypothetical protein